MNKQQLHQALKDSFQLESFRQGQEEIISSLLLGKDVLGVMPTGGGKSLCYQLPAVLKPGLSLVVSPLIALMNDQVASLRGLGLNAGAVHSGLDFEERKKVFRDIKNSENYILFLSPERVQKPGFAPWLAQQEVSLFAIDEAHCVSQWGHDFRPEYTQLSKLREWKPGVPMIALTATATPLVKKDIIKQLKLQQPEQHVYGFYRPNLYYQVEPVKGEAEKESLLLKAIEKHPEGRVIIYCGTRKKTQEWCAFLQDQGESVGYYHAGLDVAKRVEVEHSYQSGQIRILAATNAFGMGIDHPDVRLVVHAQMPGNIESYYQEVGRAGRDGLPATCLLMYAKKDKGLQSFFITQSELPYKIKSQRWSALESMVNYSEGSECRHGDILTYFKDEKRIRRCGHCDTCSPNSEQKIIKPKVISLKTKKLSKRQKKRKDLEQELDPKQVLRYESLREWRRNYAQEHDIPAFMVFSDKSLKDFVFKWPQTLEGMEEVYGLGTKKIELFGEELLGQVSILS